MKKFLKRLLYLVLIGILAFVVIYAWPRVPIITAFAAKGMCSSVFLAGKDPERVSAEDLSFFPISLARTTVDFDNKSVSARVFGLAERRAVYREGLGSVLVLDIPEEQLRESTFDIPKPAFDQDTIAWPLGDVVPEENLPGVDYDKLTRTMEAAFDEPGEEPFRKTTSLAVIYDGQLVAEKYLEGYDQDTRFHYWSMTKSMTSAVAGILIGKGDMDLRAPVNIPEWSGDERSGITLENLLHMSSGLKWLENYFTVSEATLMLMESSNMFDFVIHQPLEHSPGEFFSYSSGDANLVSGVIRKSLADDDKYYRAYYDHLLHRIGMYNTVIETDGSGMFVSSSYSYGTTRDMARFGLLYLNYGIFEGDTVLPPGWVEYTMKPAPAANTNGKYGVHFWLDDPTPGQSLDGLPEDTYSANGFLGQRIYIIPSEKLVVVRTGYSSKNFSHKQFLKDIISSLP